MLDTQARTALESCAGTSSRSCNSTSADKPDPPPRRPTLSSPSTTTKFTRARHPSPLSAVCRLRSEGAVPPCRPHQSMPLAYPPYSSRPAAQSASATIPIPATRPLTGSTVGMNDSPTADPNKYLQEAREIEITFGDRQAGPPPPLAPLGANMLTVELGAWRCRRAMMPTSSICPSGTQQLAPHSLPSNLLPTAPVRSSRLHFPTRLALRTGMTTTTTTALVPTTHRGSRRLAAPTV